jgi:sensor histidine kinase regulating citrate/malate metabolism
LEPVTEAVRKNSDIAFITIMAPDGTRFTHADPAQIGRRSLGTIEPALRGESFTEVYTGTLGPSVRSIVPVRNSSGQIVGLVSAGITLETLAAHWRSQWPVIAALALAALGMPVVGVWAIRSRLQRQTRGLQPDEMRVMYDHHDATLHSVSEGLIVFREKVAVANDEARRLLGLPAGPVARRSCLSSCARRDPARPEVHVTDDRVLVVNRSPVKRSPAPRW